MFRRVQTLDGSGTLRLVTGETLPEPGPGEALVEILASYVAPYMSQICEPRSGYQTPERPFTPGTDAIGRVLKLGDGESSLERQDLVFADLFIDAQWDGHANEAVFAGNFAVSNAAPNLLAKWRQGTFASHIVLPSECLTNVGPALPNSSVETLTRLGWLSTAYAALEKAGFKSGDQIVVLGASGQLGSSVVLLALALGAAKVTCVGRDIAKLAHLKQHDHRVDITLQAPTATDLVISAAEGNCSKMVEHAIAGLKRHARLVLLASPSSPPQLSNLVLRDITVIGSFWFPRNTPGKLVRLIAGGSLDLSAIQPHCFALERISDALAKTVRLSPFAQSVLVP